MTSPYQQHGALSRGAFTVAVLLSLAVLFAPPSDVPSGPPGSDKLVHLSLFLVLALTSRWSGIGRPATAGALVLYAAVSEVLQGTDLVNRDASVGDWLADSIGVLAGLLVWAAVSRSRRTPGR